MWSGLVDNIPLHKIVQSLENCWEREGNVGKNSFVCVYSTDKKIQDTEYNVYVPQI